MAKPDTVAFTAGQGSSLPPSDTGVSIGDIVRMLKARVWFILLCSCLGVAAAAVYVHFQKSVYEATATLRIDPSRAGSLGLSDLVANPSADQSDVVHTAVALIKSDGVAIRTLKSLSDADFERFAGVPPKHSPAGEDSSAALPDEDRLIGLLHANTVVAPEEGTQLLQVKFRNHDPDLAAKIANELVSSYILENFSSRETSVAQLQTWLSSQMKSLKDQVDTSQEKLAAFQQANQIIPTTDARNSITDRLALLNDKLTEAQVNRIAKEAQMRAAATGDPATLAALFPNPKLQALQTEQGTLYGQYAQLSTKFGAKYPPLVEMKKQLQLIDAEIAGSVDSVRSQLKQEYSATVNTQTMLQQQYQQQTKLAYALNRNQADYAELQAEVISSRQLYDTLQRKLQQAAVDTQVNSVETVVVDNARRPLVPVEPRRTLLVLSGLVLGLFSGVAAAFALEAASGLVRTPEQIEQTIGYRVLATVPSDTSTREAKSRKSPAVRDGGDLVTFDHPLSQSAEAYRVLRHSLLSSRSAGQKTILFTSALPGDGLTTAVANFAVSLAQTGARVLVVDADLRKPGLHRRFGAEDGVGLGNYLSGSTGALVTKRPLKDLQTLSLATSGQRPALPSESLASENFRELPQKLDTAYDYILIKSAPLLMVSDGLPLANWADLTVVVARYGVTGIEALSTVRRLLAQSHARVAGVVLLGAPAAIGLYAGRNVANQEYYA